MEGNNIVSSIFENFSSALDFALHGFYSMPIVLVCVGILLAVVFISFIRHFQMIVMTVIIIFSDYFGKNISSIYFICKYWSRMSLSW